MTQKSLNWAKVGVITIGTLLIGGITAGGFALDNQDDKLDDLNAQITALEEADNVPVVTVVEPTQLDNVQADVEAIKADMFAEDAIEAEAEVLALDEIEDDDYEVLFDFMVKPVVDGGLGLDIVEEEDIDNVVVRDVDSEVTDLEDREATVVHDLKVYYEDADGNDKKVYLTVESEVEDSEVEDLEVSETA